MIFSIIIPTYLRNDDLKKCLEALIPHLQGFQPEFYEIIVTDDSPNGTAQSLVHEFPFVQWVKGPGRGPAANRNHGAKQAKGEWLVFLDDDCIPSVSLLATYQSYLQDFPETYVFEGAIHPIGSKTRMDEEAPVNITGGQLWSCNFCIQKSSFFSVNGFNEAFPYACMEDVDLQSRLKEKYHILFAERAIVSHHWRRVNNISLKWKRVFESHRIFIQVNPNWSNYFNIESMLKLLLLSFFKGTILDMIRFKARGVQMNMEYHMFQVKMLFLLFQKKLAE